MHRLAGKTHAHKIKINELENRLGVLLSARVYAEQVQGSESDPQHPCHPQLQKEKAGVFLS